MILRKHIQKRLSAYFSQGENAVVGTLESPIDFQALWGEWHYRRTVAGLGSYAATTEGSGRWMTPTELFRPHYSRIIARHIAHDFLSRPDAHDGAPLHLVEFGGGRGTHAAAVLDYLHTDRPALLANAAYTLIDGSESLTRLQRRTLARFEKMGVRIDVARADVGSLVAESALDSHLSASDVPTYVCAFELLDNLPHDKVRRHPSTGRLQQAHLLPPDGAEADASPVETFRPLTDRLLRRVLERVPSYGRGPARWVPSVACALIDEIYRVRPRASLLFADFDYLPPPVLEAGEAEGDDAVGAPLVTDMDDRDHASYRRAPPLCDILFPTDFSKLAKYVAAGEERRLNVRVQKQGAFLLENGKEDVDETRSWLTDYSPLIDDFSNCSILTATPRR